MSEAAAAAGFSRLLSDERLTRRAVGGDERAFSAIFRRYHQGLYRFCLAIVGNPEDAQDALQNTMMKVLRALPGEERKIELKPWLYRIAHNESIDLLRRRRETRELSVDQPAPGYGLAEDAATRERLRQLITDLRALPDRQRDVLVMRELAGLDFEEIGVALSTSGAVARQTLYEARQSLRQMEEGREMSCDTVTKALSDGDGRVTRRRDVRAHLRSCAGCQSFRDEIKTRQRDLAALSPPPAVAAAGLLQGLIGGSQAAAGGGIAAALGGGAAQTVGVSAAAKGAATVAVAAALGVTAADRTGVIHVLPGGPKAQTTESAPTGHGHGPGGVDARSPAGGDGGGDAAKESGRGLQGSGKARVPGQGSGVNESSRGVGKGQSGVETHGNSKAMGGPKASEGSKAQGPPAEHPGGRGNENQPPAATTRGQETANSQKPVPVESPPVPDGGEGEAVVTPPKPAPPTSAPSAPPKGGAKKEEAPPGPPEAKPQTQSKPDSTAKPQPPPQSQGQAGKPDAPGAASGAGPPAEKSPLAT